MIIERLASDVLIEPYFTELFQKASVGFSKQVFKEDFRFPLNDKEFKDLLRFCDILSNSSQPQKRNKAFQIITILHPFYRFNAFYKVYSKSVFSKLGNFPAIQYLNTTDNNLAGLPIDREIEKEIKEIIQAVPESDNLIFTDSQFELYNQISDSKFFSFSGPTSMGKSFIIKSFIRRVLKNKPPENIVIMVPTRALINQFTIDLNQELKAVMDYNNYKVITNSSISEIDLPKPQNYIFVLTPERLISYLSQENNPNLGYLFVDEAHKIASGKDIRSITAYTAIERTIKKFTNINLYFSSPNVSNPEVFLNLFKKDNTKFYKTTEASVTQNLYFVDLTTKRGYHYIDNISNEFETEIINKSTTSIEFIKDIGSGENNLIYCNSRNLTIQKAKELYSLLQYDNIKISDEVKNVIQQIKSYIHKDYFLVDFLTKGIAYHFGNLPQIIRNKIEYLFKNNHIHYIFCTSTLLEGVNLPAKNVFILKEKGGDGKTALSPIDFWNLAGRAGRLKYELSGNIFCVKDNDKDWKKVNLLTKEDIILNPTISDKIDDNIKEIERLLKDPTSDIKPIYLKDILSYIANIINIDTLEFQNSKIKSVIIDKLLQEHKNEIIELAKLNTKDFIIPLSILGLNQSVKIEVQNEIYKSLLYSKNNPIDIRLPHKIDYDTCLLWLTHFYNLYKWNIEEHSLFNSKDESKRKNQIKYYAQLMNKWINGSPLSQIINESIDYHIVNNKEIMVERGLFEPFDKSNKIHVNILIGDIIDDIERKLRFLFEKYFNNYHTMLINILKEDNAGPNWAVYLEYGSTSPILIALQNTGLSRHSSNYILKNHSNCLLLENGKFKGIDKQQLKAQVSKRDVEFDEINSIIL